MALAREDRFPITDIMRQTPQIPDNCQWAIFLRNHDELTLEMVTDSERDYLWQTYATDRRARLNLGIRRRLAPLLERDRRRIELMNCLLFSMPGTPVIYYGDEIGMGDNIRLGDRDGVRTPMQWSPDRNGGFSRADPAALALPVIMDRALRLRDDQCRGPDARRPFAAALDAPHARHPPRSTPPSAAARLRFLYPENRKVLAYLRELDGEAILCVANVSRIAAGGRARPLGLQRPRAGRADRRLAVPADRPAHLPAHPAAVRLLLVHPDQRERIAVVAHAGARADAGLCHRRAAQPARRSARIRRTRPRARDAAALSAEAPLVRRQGPDPAILAHRLHGTVGRRPRHAAGRGRGQDRRHGQPLAAAAVDVLGRRAERRPAVAACAGARAARPARRPADRRLFAAGVCPPDAGRAGRRRAHRHAGRPDRLRAGARQGRGPASAGRCARHVADRRAVEQLADRRRRGDAEDLPPHLDRRASRGRDGPLSHGEQFSPMRRRCWAR